MHDGIAIVNVNKKKKKAFYNKIKKKASTRNNIQKLRNNKRFRFTKLIHIGKDTKPKKFIKQI